VCECSFSKALLNAVVVALICRVCRHFNICQFLHVRLTLLPHSFYCYQVERRVRVWWDGNADWFEADIVGYDKDTKLHLVQYCTDAEQSYEDLASYVERGLKTTVEMGQYKSSTLGTKEGRDSEPSTADGKNEEKAPTTTAEAATAAAVTKAAIAAGYEGLLYGGPCDAVKFLKKKKNEDGDPPKDNDNDNGEGEEKEKEGATEEATCSIWELLNENEKATPDMVSKYFCTLLTLLAACVCRMDCWVKSLSMSSS